MANELNDKTAIELEALIGRLDLRKGRIEHSLAALTQERRQVADELNRATQALVRLKAREKPRGAASPAISSHALLRYVERVLQIDLGMVETHILSPRNRAAIAAGATKIKSDGLTFVIKDGVVVTVLD